jgi:hypothetical protein
LIVDDFLKLECDLGGDTSMPHAQRKIVKGAHAL